ncbi:hypothetical protein [Thalassoroseus pseudoceratinae]|uniref:hypothetical protein n=1 Tax=Thalassoroseus pseudoceratinae TaxID=2713176 RepID=UPI001423A84D|nr:hypothetical protein [Thalassoroseus pseudoceratinae]
MFVWKECRNLRALVVGVLLLLSASGCGYGEVGPETYEYAMALYSVCNSRDAQRLQSFTEQFEQAQADGKVSANEGKVLGQIVKLAQAGQWDDATADARALLDAQVKR